MSHRHIQKQHSGRILWTLLLALAAPAVFAGQLRVTTWNLLPKEALVTDTNAQNAPGNVVLEAVTALKGLNPDVILLQQAPDLASCEELAKALDGGTFRVAICSSFRDPVTGEPAKQQVAILTRGKADGSYAEPWKAEGQSTAAPAGFAYASIRFENKTFGIFSVQLSDGTLNEANREDAARQLAREEAARQLVARIDALKEPGGTTVDAVLVGGDFDTSVDNPKLSREMTLARIERAGFASTYGTMASDKRVTLPGNGKRSDATADYIFARDAGTATNVHLLTVAMSEHRLVTCEFEQAPVVTLATAPTAATDMNAASTNNATAPAAAPGMGAVWHSFVAQAGVRQLWWMGGLLAGGILLLATGTILLAKRRETGVIDPMRGKMDHTLPMVIPVRVEQPEMLRAGLMGWMRERLTRRLVSDRARLMEAQQAAAVKIQSVDDRLTQVEAQIKQRNREYERRIEALEKELMTAKEDNRELIRAKIAQVRSEMERERARLMQQAQEHTVG